MGKSKIIYAGETLIDLTLDTVTPEKLEKGITAHGANGEKITGTSTRKLIFYGETVDPESFVDDTTYQDYPYRAAIILSGVTDKYKPYVLFSDADKINDIFSDIAVSYNGGVYIYASQIPSTTVSIDEIICVEE